MAVSFGVFTTMMLFGFRTFGGAAQTLLLNNYHRTDDPLASMARLATGFSILCGFPLMFAALKTSFFNAATEISEKFGEDGMKMAKRFQSDEGLRVGEEKLEAKAGKGRRGEGSRERLGRGVRVMSRKSCLVFRVSEGLLAPLTANTGQLWFPLSQASITDELKPRADDAVPSVSTQATHSKTPCVSPCAGWGIAIYIPGHNVPVQVASCP